MDQQHEAIGFAFKFGDHVDTDVIIPARYLNTAELSHLASHCMEDIDPHFSAQVQPGDVLVAGHNFGCGSSREHAPLAIKACGVACVIASSFSRIFFRNALNIGLPIVACPQAVAGISAGDRISVGLAAGEIVNHTTGEIYITEPLPDFVREMMAAGGLVPYTRGGRNGL